jgi:hypothetical protein
MTSTTVCSFIFILKNNNDINNINIITNLNENNNYTIGGDIYNLKNNNNYKIARLTSKNIDKKNTNILIFFTFIMFSIYIPFFSLIL